MVWVNELGQEKTVGPQSLARTRPETMRDTEKIGAVNATWMLSAEAAAPPVVKRRPWARKLASAVLIAAAAGGVAVAARALSQPGTVARPEPPPPPPKPAPPPVKLAIESDPAGARVSLDGQKRCLTPCTLERPGGQAALLRLDKDAYLPWSALVGGPDAQPLKAKLRPKAPSSWGAISLVTGTPANVWVGGKPIGYAAGPGGEDDPLWLPPGETTLELAPLGGGPKLEVKVTVKSGATAQVAVTSP
jgi:hypothetical protein